MKKQILRFLLPLTMIAFLAACNALAPTADTPATTAELDREAIAQAVMEEIQTQMAAVEPNEQLQISYAAPAVGLSTDLENSLIHLYQQANPATVYIIVPPLGSGSGFIYNSAGYIVTNNHVVSGGAAFEVVFANGERREAKLIGTDVDSDLAVIKVSDLPEGVEPLPLGDSSALQVGQFVAAIGNPFGEQGSMSMGIISGLGRSLTSQRVENGNSYSLPEVVQTDTPINPGNSGGPLLNLAGEVVGINSAIISSTGTNSGVGFSIPVNAVKRIIPSLIENGRYTYPYMGAGFDDEVSLGDLAVYGLSQTQGAYVVGVTANSPADQAGLVAADPNTGRGGDLIIALDGQPISDFGDLNSYLVFNSTVGQTIDLTVLRGGEQINLPLTLGARP